MIDHISQLFTANRFRYLYGLLTLHVCFCFDGTLHFNCTAEHQKQLSETKFRNNTAVVWVTHIQRSAGYKFCDYARANGVLDAGTAVGCPSCPCGHGFLDKLFRGRLLNNHKLQHAILKFKSNNKGQLLPHSKKDASVRARPMVKDVNLIELEYWTHLGSPVQMGEFVYITLLRDPVQQFLSWVNRFEGVNINWTSSKSMLKLSKVLRTSSPKSRSGGFSPHSRLPITRTFSTTSPATFSDALQSLLKYNFVFTFDNLLKDSKLVKEALGWVYGRDLLTSIGKVTNTYRKYNQNLHPAVRNILSKYLESDILLYNTFQGFNAMRRRFSSTECSADV